MNWVAWFLVVVIVVTTPVFVWIRGENIKECRKAGFSRNYCIMGR